MRIEFGACVWSLAHAPRVWRLGIFSCPTGEIALIVRRKHLLQREMISKHFPGNFLLSDNFLTIIFHRETPRISSTETFEAFCELVINTKAGSDSSKVH